MATNPKTTRGTMKCLCCGQTIPVKASDNGTLSFPCTWCDFPAYAKSGTEAHRIVTKLITPAASSEPPPAPGPELEPESQPAPPAAPAKPRGATWMPL
jgi:hypothetical protein